MKEQTEDKFSKSGFGQSLKGTQEWPPKTVNAKLFYIGVDLITGESKTIQVQAQQQEVQFVR